MIFLQKAAVFLPIPAALLLLTAGIWFTGKLRAFWLIHPIRTLRAMPFREGVREMLLSLGGTVGVGNIVGVALAISLGGAGALFWMWVAAFLAMAVKYAEIVLGQCTRKREGDRWIGGAAYYIRNFLGKIPGGAFAVLLLLDSLLTGGILQSSAISEAAGAFSVSPVVTGVLLALAAGVIFFFGANLFALSAVIVPAMSVGYILLSLGVLFTNAARLPAVFGNIFTEAFAPRSLLGILTSPALTQGVVKGLFSNEAGCGTAPTAHIAAKEKSPAKQGLFGILEVFCDTIVVCSLTGLCILVTTDTPRGGGVRICMDAFATLYGSAAPILLGIFVLLFAFATILSFGYYGVQGLCYFGNRGKAAFLTVYCLSLFVGSVAAPHLLWSVTDAVLCLMLLLNTAAVLAGGKTVLAASREIFPAIPRKRNSRNGWLCPRSNGWGRGRQDTDPSADA